MSHNLLHTTEQNRKNWRIPNNVLLAVAIFIIVNSITALNVRGVADDAAGYQWNGAHYIPINTYEDDGRFNVYAALGYKGFSEKHEHLINIGGPYIHVARFLIWPGDKMGIVKKFKDPLDYYIYPEEYLKIWEFIGLYKAMLLLGWMPLVIYWIGSRHFSESTGVIASWLTVAIPFVTGFEPRIKADSVAIILGLFSILWQLEYVKSGKSKYFILAAVFLGISFSVKFNMLSAALTPIITYVIVLRREGQNLSAFASWKKLLAGLCTVFGVFIAANPFVIKWLGTWLKDIFIYMHNAGSQPSSGIIPVVRSIGYRIIHFDSLFGMALNWLVIPALIFSIIRLFIRSGHRSVSSNILLIVLWGFIAYIALIMRDSVVLLTYYYYAPAILLLILISDLLAAIFEKALSFNKVAAVAVGAIIIGLIGATAYDNSRVFAYMISKTNRQEMHRWIERNIPNGTVIGIPLNPGISFFSSTIRLDPFKYNLIFIGDQAQLLEEKKPDYFIWSLSSKDAKTIINKDYKIAAEFAKGTDLPHERYDLYQEEEFELYKLNAPHTGNVLEDAFGRMEYGLGSFLKKDPEGEFRVLQFQAISFMPQWLNLMRKSNGTLNFDSAEVFERAIWGDKADTAKYGYIHQIGPTTLQLWGVKYILAKTAAGSPVQEYVLNSGRYNLKEIDFPDGVKRDAGVFYNNDYLGQIFFARYDKAKEYKYERKLFSWLRIWKKKDADDHLRDTLFDAAALRGLNADNLAVYMEIKSEKAVSVTIRGGGNAESWIAGGATKTIWMPFRIINRNEPIIYEINPLEGAGRIVVNRIELMPLTLQRAPVEGNVKIHRREGVATVVAGSGGEIIFSLPYNKYWKAKVDGKDASVKKGLAGTVAVEILRGKHSVEIYF